MPNSSRFIIVSKDAVFCEGIKDGLKTFPSVGMVVSVGTPEEAENKIVRTAPTIMLIDVDSSSVPDPSMLTKLMARYNNVLVVLTARVQSSVRRLTMAGIRDFSQKPAIFNKPNIERYLKMIIDRMGGIAAGGSVVVDYKNIAKSVGVNDKIIVIASSTGGVEAVEKVIARLPATVPPILLVQHMPSGFTKLFASRLNGLFPLNIKEAQTGDYLLQGQMLIAPAGNHMRLVQKQGKLAVDCFLGPKMHGVIPAADILFESVANIQKKNAIGVILTGMGADGGRGLMLMHNSGAKTIGQNQESCVVYGMPKVARDLGAVDFEIHLENIAAKIMSLV